jgi:translocation and assembly module TamA
MTVRGKAPAHTRATGAAGRWSLLARLLPLLLMLLASRAEAARVAVRVEGLNRELEAAARNSLTLQQYTARDVTAAQVRRLFNQGKDEIRRGLQPAGYYNASVDATLETTPEGFTAVYRVVPGERTLVRASTVRVLGAAAAEPTVQRALRRFKPALNEPLDDAQYEASKSAVDTALYSAGFLNARQTTHEVRVTRADNSAEIEVIWDGGERFKFGAVRFPETQFSQEFLQRYVPWKEGEYFSSAQMLKFQQQLVSADYFSSVIVQPDLRAAKDGIVPIDVSLRPAKRTVYTAGVYVTTDTGVGVRAGVQRRWVNSRGHKATFSIDEAQRQEQIALVYQIPLLGPDNRALNFGASYIDTDTSTTVSRMARVALNETRQWHGFSRELGLQYMNGVFFIGPQRQSTNLLYAQGTLSIRHADDYAFAHHGYSLGLTLRAAPENPLTATSFAEAQLDAKWIVSPFRRQRLILRGTLGAMTVKDFDVLPPELRFFAGGDRSIRGFDYQEIGEKNANGDVIGGKFLAVASTEYEYYFLRNWGVATFVDAGDAFFYSDFSWNVGAGLGVRWRSPVGVIRVDVGVPVVSQFSHTVRYHVQIGPDL